MLNLNKISITSLIIRTLSELSAFLNQGRLFVTYALIITLLYAVFGQWSHSCHAGNEGWWCFELTGSKATVISVLSVYLLIQSYLFLSFCCDVYVSAFKKEKFQIQNIFRLNLTKLKKIGVLLAYIAAFALPMFIGLQILLKQANPDWRIEFCYFVILFILCWIPLWTIRLSSGISYFLDNGRIPNIKMIIERTAGKNILMVLVFCFIMILINVISLQFSILLNGLAAEYSSFSVAILTEFVGVFLKLVYISIFLSYLRAQQVVLQQMENESAGENSAEVKE